MCAQLFAKGAKSVATSDNEVICEQFSLGAGPGEFRLVAEDGSVSGGGGGGKEGGMEKEKERTREREEKEGEA